MERPEPFTDDECLQMSEPEKANWTEFLEAERALPKHCLQVSQAGTGVEKFEVVNAMAWKGELYIHKANSLMAQQVRPGVASAANERLIAHWHWLGRQYQTLVARNPLPY